MLYLKTKLKYGNAGYPLWVDAVDSIYGMIKAYPQTAGQGTIVDKAKNILSNRHLRDVYEASYTSYREENAILLELEHTIISLLPDSIKKEQPHKE